MAAPNSFTIQKRERFLVGLERGEFAKDAAKSVGIAHSTVQRWIADGREANDQSEKALFARRYDAIRACSVGTPQLTQDDLVTMLEVKARTGTVTAIIALLNRPWETAADAETGEKPKERTFADELAVRRNAKAASN